MIYTIIQYLTLIILSIGGFYYLTVERSFVLKSAFGTKTTFPVINLQYLLLFIFATAIIGCGGELMSIRLLVCIILCFIGLLSAKGIIPLSIPIVFYTLYLCWLLIEIGLSPVKGFGFRVFLKYLYPFLILLFASKLVQLGHAKDFYLKGLKIILYLGIFSVFWFSIMGIPFVYISLSPVLFFGTALLDFLPIPLTISLYLYSLVRKKKYLFYSLLFVLPCIWHTNRTGLLAISITIVLFSIVRYRIKSIPYVLIGCSILIGSVLYIPQFRDKMFNKQMSADEILERRDELTADDIDTNGRFAIWEWSLNNYYKGSEWKGSGLGVLQEFLYSDQNPWTITAVHNDYVQILCDTGLIGLSLYILALLSIITHSLVVYFRARSQLVKMASFIAGVGLASMLSTLYTDNVVNYSLMTLSFPFALYGMMLGLKRGK